jgi:hypothetical protein
LPGRMRLDSWCALLSMVHTCSPLSVGLLRPRTRVRPGPAQTRLEIRRLRVNGPRGWGGAGDGGSGPRKGSRRTRGGGRQPFARRRCCAVRAPRRLRRPGCLYEKKRCPWDCGPKGTVFCPSHMWYYTPGPEGTCHFSRAGRYSGFRITLPAAPSHPYGQWHLQLSSPITAAAPRRNLTVFPCGPLGPPVRVHVLLSCSPRCVKPDPGRDDPSRSTRAASAVPPRRHSQPLDCLFRACLEWRLRMDVRGGTVVALSILGLRATIGRLL